MVSEVIGTAFLGAQRSSVVVWELLNPVPNAYQMRTRCRYYCLAAYNGLPTHNNDIQIHKPCRNPNQDPDFNKYSETTTALIKMLRR